MPNSNYFYLPNDTFKIKKKRILEIVWGESVVEIGN
jgi:hypothetical protein